MNPLCSESAIRKAADWRAFKHGRELVATVTDAAPTESGWRGAVRDGGRSMRVAVIARTPTDIETRCPCRENQSGGAFCAHAIAVGLALASGKTQSTTPIDPATATPEANSTAWEIEFPPPWRRMLATDRLAIKISASPNPPDATDASLTTWLMGIKAPQGGMLQLDGARLAGFLTAAADHPRIVCQGVAVEITPYAMLRIASVERDGEDVVIAPQCGEIHRIDELSAEITENRISLISARLPAEFAALSGGKPARISLKAFLNLADSFGDALAWPDDGWLAALSFVAAKPDIEITLSGTPRTLAARPIARYGNSPGVVPGTGNIPGLPELIGNICRIRNRNAESHVVELLERNAFTRKVDEPALWQLSDESRIPDFLNEALPMLQSRYAVHLGPGLTQHIRDAAVITPKFDIVSSGEDWLEFNLSFHSGDSDAVVDSMEVWRMLKAGGGGKPARLSRELSEVVEPMFADLDLSQKNGHFIARGASVECIINIRNYFDKANIKNELTIHEFEIPATLNAELRPYQFAGAAWIFSRLKSFQGALLADDMGLGKTIQSIALIERLFLDSAAASQSVLVVATTSLLGNWSAEFAKFAPARRVRILHGPRRDAEKERAEPGEVWLTSYGTLTRDLAWYLRQDFLAVVVDEASLMRNPDTDHAKAVCKLKTTNRLALTGTPVENGVRDLWSIFRFIQPGWLGGRQEFQSHYEAPGGEGNPWALKRLRLKTSPFMLRRTKDEVAPDLPSKILIDEFVELSHDQQVVYRQLLIEGRQQVDQLANRGQMGAARMQVLTALLRLRQACCDLALLKNDRLNRLIISKRSAKIERLLELVNSAIVGNHKMLIFSQFKSQLREIRKCLKAQNIETLVLDGDSRDRQELVDRFQSTAGPPVFLISLKAGGYGLNLTAADVVIHFDPWWNPAAEAQATDRAHRIGQTRPVTVYRLLARGTVEEKVVSLQRRKRAVALAIDESGGGDAPGLNDMDLAALLE